jgi:diacylglycerol kinase family enzyme
MVAKLSLLTVDILVNPRARRLGDGGPVRKTLLDAASRGGARVHITTSFDDLEHAARRIAAAGTTGVIVAGGDGTCMTTLSALARAFGSDLPSIGFAPCGTVSTIAKNLGARGGARAWTERLVDAACAGAARVRSHATLRVRDDAGGDRVGFIFGAGLVARFFDVYDALPRRGSAAAGVIAARVFAGSFLGSAFARRVLRPSDAAVSLDGRAVAGRAWTLLLASVVRDVGLHFLVTYRAGERDDAFHAVGSCLPPRRLGPQLPRVLAGRPLRGDPSIDAIVRSLDVHFEGAQDRYVLDGEVFAAGAVEVGVGPRIEILSPR